MGERHFYDARLWRDSVAQGYRRGDHRHAGPLAQASQRGCDEGGQGRLLREADDSPVLRRAGDDRDGAGDGADYAGGKPESEFADLFESEGTAGGGRHRATEYGDGALGSELDDGRVELYGSSGCLARDVRLAAVSGHRAEDSV